ncbi:(Fe-S)-binding protein [Xanthobacter autotrophicus]|uniref:(Fe-S)-binding protein n=1 Tax=Xanthobacter autotrophicus TaxID=280 RepID=UPI00372A05D5
MTDASPTLEALHDKVASCTRCTFCKWVPEVRNERFAEICPSVQHGKFFSHTAGGKLIAAYALLHGRIDYTADFIRNVYSCSMCGGCDTSCKTLFAEFVEPLDSLYALRRKVTEDGHAPAPLREMLDHLGKTGNARGLPAERRGDWFAGMGLKQTAAGRATVLFHIGEAAFDEEEWPFIRHVASALARHGVDFAVGGADEPDTGGLAYDIGDQDLAAKLARQTRAWVEKSGARTLITYGDDAFSAFLNIYPRLRLSLGEVRIVHVSQWLAEHSAAAAGGTGDIVTYHDSCRLGRLGEERQPWEGETVMVYNSLPARSPEGELHLGVHGVYEPPRQVLAAAGAQIVEMERIREFAFCCGAGGGGKQANPEFARAAARHRLKEAESTGAQILVTSCTACSRHMKEVADAERSSIKVLGLVEYLHARQAAPALAALSAGE